MNKVILRNVRLYEQCFRYYPIWQENSITQNSSTDRSDRIVYISKEKKRIVQLDIT